MTPPAPRPSRAALAGVLTLVSLVAFEALAIATAMPVVARDLGGLRQYGLAFSLFLTTSLFGMVLAGGWADARGPRQPAVAGLALFAAGLVLCGLAPTFLVLLLGRVVAGVGGGLVVVTLYVVIGLVWSEEQRPRIFAWVSSAWVVPSLVGPPLAGWLADDVSWRLVFLLVPPMVLVAAALLVRPLRAVPAGPSGPRGDAGPTGARGRVAHGGLLALGAVLVQWGATSVVPLRVLPVLALAVGAAAVAAALPRLLPRGTLRAARGLPSVVGSRGLFTACFVGAESYLPLMLVTQRGLDVTTAGLTLTGGALGWAFGSFVQGRPRLRTPRHRLMAVAGVLVGTMVATLALPALALVPAWAVLPAWTAAGAGMGLALSTTGVLVLRMSPEAARGRNSSALQLSDALGAVLGISAGGAVLAAATGAAGAATGEHGGGGAVASGATFALIFGGLALAGLAAAVFGARARPPAQPPAGPLTAQEPPRAPHLA